MLTKLRLQIMVFPSKELYDAKLIAHESVAFRTLAELPELQETSKSTSDDDGLLTEPVVFYDTAGAGMFERAEDTDSDKSLKTVDGESKSNENEAEIVMKFIDELVGHDSLATLLSFTKLKYTAFVRRCIGYCRSSSIQYFSDLTLQCSSGFAILVDKGEIPGRPSKQREDSGYRMRLRGRLSRSGEGSGRRKPGKKQ